MDHYQLSFKALSRKVQLSSFNMLPDIEQALRLQGCVGPDHSHYRIAIEIHEGGTRPCKDVENYYKPIIDNVTYSKLLWYDDHQIDQISVRRVKADQQLDTDIVIDIWRLARNSVLGGGSDAGAVHEGIAADQASPRS